jgi:hypothetical protein
VHSQVRPKVQSVRSQGNQFGTVHAALTARWPDSWTLKTTPSATIGSWRQRSIGRAAILMPMSG